MKIKGKSIITTALITLVILLGISVGVALLLVPAVIGTPESPAGENVSGVGYASPPQNQALLITTATEQGALILLNFDDTLTHIYLFEENAEESVASLPYVVTCRMEIPEDFLGRLCDRLGGIDIEQEGKTQRYFSASLSEYAGKSPSKEKMLIISKSFFEKIANIGLSSEDFMYIIELCNTDLTYSVCYGWINNISEMCSNCIFY